MTGFIHEPVLLEEVLKALRPVSGGLYVDGTVGGGGHSAAILEACSPEGRLVAFDRDDWALEAAAKRLARFGNRLELHREAFAGLAKLLVKRPCDGVLLDLGVSSPQLDEAERGFSFQSDGPLDMRMDRRQPVTAEQLVNELEPEELAEIFWKLGGERKSRRIARAIVEQRSMQRLETTLQLAEVVERACPRRGARTHPATGVFQALRMAVNDELGQVQRGLEAGWSVLKPGGRLGLNVQDPSRPHQSRVLLSQAIAEAGLGDRRQDSNPVLGSTDEELSALFAANGFTDYRSELRALVDIHDNADSLLRWSEASAFGNFLEAFSPAERSLVRQAFARLVEDKRTPEGLSLERYLRFAFVRKAPTAN